jgi:hypothetical protein
MQSTWLAAYPWDALDQRPDDLLDRLRGEWGVTGLALYASSGPIHEFRAREILPRIVRTCGGLYFAPDEPQYHASRCRVPAADFPQVRHAVERMLEACRERNLPLRIVLSATRIGALADRHPEFAVRNAFGEASTVAVCLINPDVQVFLCAMVADLGSRPMVESLLIEDFEIRWTDVDDPRFDQPVPTPPEFSRHIGICFCESCRQRSLDAGVDAEVAARMVRETIDATLTRAEPPPPSRPILHKPIDEYFAWQATELRRLRDRTKKACPCPLRWLADGKRQETETPDSSEDSVLRIRSGESLNAVASTATPPREISLSPKLLAEISGPELVRGLVAAAERGVAGGQFEHYGVLSESLLTAIRQALRFARRTNL